MKKLAVGMLLSCSMMFVACGDSEEVAPPANEPVDEGTISIGGVADFDGQSTDGSSVRVQLIAADGVETKDLTYGQAFSFDDKLVEDETYQVVIVSSPVGWTCGVINNSGQAEGVNISNIQVECN
jgi:hypothetical protein